MMGAEPLVLICDQHPDKFRIDLAEVNRQPPAAFFRGERPQQRAVAVYHFGGDSNLLFKLQGVRMVEGEEASHSNPNCSRRCPRAKADPAQRLHLSSPSLPGARSPCAVVSLNDVNTAGLDPLSIQPIDPLAAAIGPLTPSPYYSIRGPGAAAGLVIWSHGVLSGSDNRNHQPSE